MTRDQLVFAFVVVELKRKLGDGMIRGPFTADDVKWFSPYDRETEGPTIALTNNEIETVLSECEAKKLLIAYRSEDARTRYVAEQEAVDAFVTKNASSAGSAFHQYSVLGVTWLAEVLWNLQQGSSNERLPNNNTAHDVWTPLPIDRRHPDYEPMMVALDEVWESTRTDNGYSATYPDERDAVLDLLAAGLEWLRKRTSVLRHQLDAYIIQPLKRLMFRFGDAAVGVAAKKAVEAVWKHFFES